MRSIIGRVATGPEYSKDLSFEESRAAMHYILNNRADPVQAGVYLIALRMKRETDAENGGSLQAILDETEQMVADVDAVVDIAEPYDGYMRGAPVMAFLPALAGCLRCACIQSWIGRSRSQIRGYSSKSVACCRCRCGHDSTASCCTD